MLYPLTKELLKKLRCEDIYYLEYSFPFGSKFTTEEFIDYSGTKNYNQYLAYTLDSDYGVESSKFGRSRFLKPSEQKNIRNYLAK